MQIINNIIDQALVLVKNNKIIFSFNTEQDSCSLSFNDSRIRIHCFYNIEEKLFYYMVYFTVNKPEYKCFELTIERSRKDLYEKTKGLFELVKSKYFNENQILISMFEELKKGIFEDNEAPPDITSVKVCKIPDDSDDLPF